MRLVIIALYLVAVSVAQHSQNAAILSDMRYLSGDGTFGASYKQEDGVEFKEESDANGDRKGSYSYVDPNGVRRTVTYTAGKNGFQVRDELKVIAIFHTHELEIHSTSPAFRIFFASKISTKTRLIKMDLS
ncbi:flexible cuticle protein 12-like [Fopius arisanus]|uniref:Flexible cuticle protein 12-like n=1 Tax=Fopius arisanus TaxID=64838 RepID=A0A9R1TQK4_9HYME|nr:PREDICTED: flexible cuticle protein 12-like [Fopius arisanus]